MTSPSRRRRLGTVKIASDHARKGAGMEVALAEAHTYAGRNIHTPQNNAIKQSQHATTEQAYVSSTIFVEIMKRQKDKNSKNRRGTTAPCPVTFLFFLSILICVFFLLPDAALAATQALLLLLLKRAAMAPVLLVAPGYLFWLQLLFHLPWLLRLPRLLIVPDAKFTGDKES